MKRTMVAAASLLMLASAAHAQTPFALELRGGAAIPTADLDQTALKTGGGFEVNGSYRLMPHVLAYVGWDWTRLATDELFFGADYDVESTGYAFGVQLQHPLLRSFEYFVRAGGIYNHIELEDDAGEIVADSGHELGWEVGGGFSVPILQALALTPGVRYRTFPAEIDVGDGNVPVDLSFLAVEVGLVYRFGARGIAARR